MVIAASVLHVKILLRSQGRSLATIPNQKTIMTKNIVSIKSNVSALLDKWLEAERNGEQFPVPFDDAWNMAGYSNKANAKRALLDLIKGEDFSSLLMNKPSSNASKVSRSQCIKLTCDAFKSFCLMAKTDEGKMTRSYFIDAEKKWKLVQQIAPQVASEVELMAMKIELAKIESQKALAECQKIQSENQLLQFRHYISTALPEFQQQKILGYEVVERIETRDRIIDDLGYVLNDGSTVTKKDLCKRLGFLSKTGASDYKRLNHYLDKLPHSAFEEVAIMQENRQLRRDWIAELERMVNESDRQKWIGE